MQAPRNVWEGISQGVDNFSGAQSSALDNASKRMQMQFMAARLRALSNGGGGSTPGYTINPMNGQMMKDLSDQEIGRQERAKIEAQNNVSDDQAGIQMPSDSGGSPQFLSQSQLQAQNTKPPIGMPARQPLGVQPPVLGISGNQPPSSGQIPLVKTEVSGGKASYKQDPIALDALKKQQEEAQESGLRGDAAENNMRFGSQLFDELQKSNHQGVGKILGDAASKVGIAPERVEGKIGQMKGSLGMNPANTGWEEFTNTAATQLAAAASPRTPTMLVQYYKQVLGPPNQTKSEFQQRVKVLTSEIEARKSGFNKTPYDQGKSDAVTQDILSSGKKKVGRFTLEES